MRLTHDIISIENLEPHAIESMYQLMRYYYDNLHREKFLKDLNEKEGVLLGHDENGEICGFTTYAIFEIYFKEEKIRILFSGDTVIREEFWGKWSTAKSFITLIKKMMECGEPKCYWFLLTKGVRTYQYLPLYFKEYYPSPQFETPDYEKDLIVQLSRLKFGNCYLEHKGIIRFNPPADRLKEKYLSFKEKMDDPFIQFFMQKNPGHINGDELPCLARISIENLTSISHRWLKS